MDVSIFLVEYDQVDNALLQPGRQLDEVLERAAEPVEFGDHELVARPVSNQERLAEFGPASGYPEALSMKICSQLAPVSASC